MSGTVFYLTNAFSLNMLPAGGHNIAVRPINVAGVKNLMRAHAPKSIVGHEDTAKILSGILGEEVECNREQVALPERGWSLIVAKIGQRLPAGTTTLPDGVEISFSQVYPT